jgi:hypothetical protein
LRTDIPCPVCRHPITLGTILGATTPSRIRCKNCRYRLRPGQGAMFVLMIILLIAGPISFFLGFWLAILYLDGHISLFNIIMILMIVIVPIIIVGELIFGLFVCNKSGLVVNERQ